MKQDKLSEYVVALYDALENDIVNDYTLNVKAYADVFKEELMQKEEIERIKTPHLPNFCFCPRCGNALVRNGKFAEKVKVVKGSTVECGVCHIEIDVGDKSLDNR